MCLITRKKNFFRVSLWGMESWLLCFVCLPGVTRLLCGSSLWCHGFVCSLWLWYFLIILTNCFSVQVVFKPACKKLSWCSPIATRLVPNRNCLAQFHGITWDQTSDVHRGSTLITWGMTLITWCWSNRNHVNTITHVITAEQTVIWAAAWDFQQFDIWTSVDLDEPLQPAFKLRNSKWCSVSSWTIIEYSNA